MENLVREAFEDHLVKMENLEALDKWVLLVPLEKQDQRVQLENLVTQDHKDCLVYKDNLDHRDLRDHRVRQVKLLLPLRHWDLVTVCLVKLDLQDPWGLPDHLGNVEHLENEGLKVVEECLDQLEPLEQLERVVNLEIRVCQENLVNLADRAVNIPRRTFEKFARPS